MHLSTPILKSNENSLPCRITYAIAIKLYSYISKFHLCDVNKSYLIIFSITTEHSSFEVCSLNEYLIGCRNLVQSP